MKSYYDLMRRIMWMRLNQSYKNICDECALILPKPGAKILLSQVIDRSSIELKLLYWSKSDLAFVRDEVLSTIKSTFEQESIGFMPYLGK
jgi:small conductance mechanosensitive channel